MSKQFDLLLFSIDAPFAVKCLNSGIDGIIVDMENKGKSLRQQTYNTQINFHTLDDLKRMSEAIGNNGRLICRINSYGEWTRNEIEEVIQIGVDEILLPMVRSSWEVEKTLEIIKNRCQLGILLETQEALKRAAHLAALPLSRVYVGLNDLHIEQKSRNIFIPLTNGEVEQIRSHFSCPFGFGGLTLPDKGSPVPCRLLMNELCRLSADYTFLRRSFLKDIVGTDIKESIASIKKEMQITQEKSQLQKQNNHQKFKDLVRELSLVDGQLKRLIA